MFRKWIAPALVFTLAAGLPALQAQQTPTERIDTEMNAKIRKEGMDNSQSVPADSYGGLPAGVTRRNGPWIR
jgi:hypothetical protein